MSLLFKSSAKDLYLPIFELVIQPNLLLLFGEKLVLLQWYDLGQPSTPFVFKSSTKDLFFPDICNSVAGFVDEERITQAQPIRQPSTLVCKDIRS
jgi:hypothetical protein